jgi:dTMP kinase
MLIAIEGIDGSGKATIARLLYKHLSKTHKVFLTKEPTDSKLAKLAYGVLLKKNKGLSPTALQLLFIADRAQHVDTVINPKLKAGYIVITDRYIPSTLAYGSVSGVNQKWLISVNAIFPEPDITLILDVSPAIASKRLSSEGKKKDIFEGNASYLKMVRAKYKALAKHHSNCIVINAAKDLRVVEDKAANIIDSYMS